MRGIRAAVELDKRNVQKAGMQKFAKVVLYTPCACQSISCNIKPGRMGKIPFCLALNIDIQYIYIYVYVISTNTVHKYTYMIYMYITTPSGAPLIDEAGATNETFNSWKAANLRVWAALRFPRCENDMNGCGGLNQLTTINIT